MKNNLNKIVTLFFITLTIGFSENNYSLSFDGIDDWIVFVYTANNFEGNLIDCDEGKLDWVSDDQLLKLNLWEGDKIFIPWLTQDKFFSAKFIYEKKKLINYDVIFY